MAKLFYSIDEAAQKLGKSTDDVRDMARRGQITEFRDGDRLIFKKDQIDLLAGDDSEEGDLSGMIPLSDSAMGTGMGSGLGLADSSAGLGDTKQEGSSVKTGISIFDDEQEQDDPSAQTQVTSGALDAASLDSFGGAASGMMDFTREEDSGGGLAADSMLGELYAGGSVAGAGAMAGSGAGLFEGQAASGGLAAAPVGGGVVLAEPYDGKGSGLAGGLAIAMVLTVLGAVTVMLMGMIGSVPGFVRTTFDGNILIWVGIAAGVALVFGAVGFFVGGKTE